MYILENNVLVNASSQTHTEQIGQIGACAKHKKKHKMHCTKPNVIDSVKYVLANACPENPLAKEMCAGTYAKF